ncbi:hypothetical protein [Streptomyces sp. NPDC049879]
MRCARSWYARHREAAEVLAFGLLAAVVFSALGAGLYFLAAAANGWKG